MIYIKYKIKIYYENKFIKYKNLYFKNQICNASLAELEARANGHLMFATI